MLVGVCDFPSRYAFPSAGYGGIERWLWAAATGARKAGTDVPLLSRASARHPAAAKPGLGEQTRPLTRRRRRPSRSHDP
jgi:hypothetical protein